MAKKRLFVAIEMPEEVRREIEAVQRFLRPQRLFHGTYAQAKISHLTLCFVGEVDEGVVPDIQNALANVSFSQISCTLGSLNVFERRGFISVIFMNLSCPQLAALASDVAQVLAPWVEPEERDFVSHVTVARVKKVDDKDALLRAIGSYEVPAISFDIDSFVLMASELRPEGPEYTVIKKYDCLVQTA